MKVSVTFFGDAPESVAKVMIQSVRNHMDCPIVQLTDKDTKALDGVDEVIRRPVDDFGEFRLKHFLDMDGDVLHLDYDVIVNRDVRDVFNQDFDVAITRRNENDKTVSQKINMVSPHNMGVVFSRNPEFWESVLKHYKSVPITSWMWIQIALTECACTLKNRFKILELPGDVYNYTPLVRGEDVSQRAIVHYKGHRKHWMAEGGESGGEIVQKMMSGMSQKIFYTEKHPLARP